MNNDQRLKIEDWEAEDRPSSIINHQSSRLISYSQPAPGITAADFLAQAKGSERFFWEDVRDRITFAGFGTAVNLFAWGENRFQSIQEQAQNLFANAILLNETSPLAAPRLFGGFAFRDDFTPDNTWAAFHPAHFILPHYQLVQVGGDSWLTINALIPREEDPTASLPVLREALATRYAVLKEAREQGSGGAEEKKSPLPPRSSAPLHLDYPMPYDTWAEKINDIRQQIRTTPLKKVVLS
ncbi:MAG: hypothetical protein P8183_23970, partial [Anaerolineae bacterium]